MAEDQDEDFDDDVDFDSGGYDEGGGKKRLILFVVLPLLLVIGGAAGAYFSGLADPLLAMLGGEEPPPVEEMAEGEGGAEGADVAPGAGGAPVGSAIFYDLPEMLVNLNTPGREHNVVRITPEMGDEVMITADLHGHRRNYAKIRRIADLANNPKRHLVLQEVCHGGPTYPSNGGCMSHTMLEDVARLK
nr:hypothetical protein [Alphaproteobacteria bacterium]